ncbi:IE-1 [Parapoynx stagnalis nucleopolyhedrovirus]|uniref:IE-1 n=1 Tax=Parapoynx stagnalis nucleopolyhedrovirus TaxID=2993413 RepID=A0A9E8BWC9_9ABAC|nr:IE-1 [Parapoynx stagnalis nucleopolyhedrovirus]
MTPYASNRTPARQDYGNVMSEFLKIKDNSEHLAFQKNIPQDFSLQNYDQLSDDGGQAAEEEQMNDVRHDDTFIPELLEDELLEDLSLSSNLVNSLLTASSNLNSAVNLEYSFLTQNGEFPSEEENSSESNSNKRKRDEKDIVSGEFNKSKIRPRYKKLRVEDCVTAEQVINHCSTVTTVATTTDISNYFVNNFTPYLMQFENNDVNANKFTEHLSETGYYMFIVKKCLTKPFEIVFAKYVTSVSHEYTKNYYSIDNRVFVVTFENIRFMISYNLVKECNIDIPPSQDLCSDETALKDNEKCYFTDVQSFNFKVALTRYFNLDMYYAQTKMITLMQSLGESKSSFLLTKLYNMFQDKSLFTLPIMLSRKDSVTDHIVQKNDFVISPYVQQVINLSRGLEFRSSKPFEGLHTSVHQKSSLTYKYSSVANVFFDKADALKKVKKEDGSLHIIEQYLSQNAQNVNSNNFIVLSFKNDERLTIVKKQNEYYWIFGEVKNINVHQIVYKFNNFIHHLFVIGKVNRRESNTTHNYLLKLVALIVQNHVSLGEGITYAKSNLNCNYQSFILINNAVYFIFYLLSCDDGGGVLIIMFGTVDALELLLIKYLYIK